MTGLSDAICDFLRSFSLPLIEKSNFLTFFSEKNINFLINLTLNAASCKQALSILVLCFENVFIPSISEEIKESLNYSFFLQKTLENLKTLSSYLRIKEEPYLNSLKIMIEPLGMSKLLIVILIKELLKRNEPIINESLFNSKILKDCFELIFRFQWNNALHCLIQEMFQFLTRNKNSDLLRQVKI